MNDPREQPIDQGSDDSNAARQELGELWEAIQRGDLKGITLQLKKHRQANPLDDPAVQKEYEDWLDGISHF